MHRFYVLADQIRGEQAHLTGNQHKQIRRVLRLGVGELIVLFDGSGREHITRIESFKKHRVLGRVIESHVPDTEPRRRLSLVLGVLKGGRTEFALQKCTEIGASEFVIVQTSRSVPQLAGNRVNARLDRWRTIAKEAAEQSGRTRLPAVNGVLSFDDALARVRKTAKGVIAWEQEKRVTLLSALGGGRVPEEVTFFVGPEGGFTEDEVAAAREAGVIPVSLGPRTLRAETAAVVGSALIIYAVAD